MVVRCGPVPLIPDETEKEDLTFNFTTTKTKLYHATAAMTSEMTQSILSIRERFVTVTKGTQIKRQLNSLV